MTKKHFIALADMIKTANTSFKDGNDETQNAEHFTPYAIKTLADFCASQNPNFNRERWLSYIAGECGKNGGSVKASKKVEVVR